MSDFLIICLIDFSVRSWWWMIIFVQSVVIKFHRRSTIKTVMTERAERGEIFLLPPPPPSPSHFSAFQCSVCCSFLFGHWFRLEYISVRFKFSWGKHDPTAACRRCSTSTGILLASCFYCLCLSTHILLVLFLSLIPFTFCFLRYFPSFRQ